ncbi:MAG: MFS transporter [Sphingobacteriaceae bacterium]|nr:MAG: MFS transporter [Sphingobacteriaceae bacterium]
MTQLKASAGLFTQSVEEKNNLTLLFILSLFTGISTSFYFVAANTLLIQKSSVVNLPYAYIISGLVGFFIIKLYRYRQRHTNIVRCYFEMIFYFAVVCMAMYFIVLTYGRDRVFGIYVAYLAYLFNMPFTIIFSLGFFSVCARIFNLSQSKRLLALAGTGDTVASILAYIGASGLTHLTGNTTNLLLFASISILLSIFPLYIIYQYNGRKLSDQPAVSGYAPQKINVAFFLKDNFYRLIAAATIFSVAAIYFVDYGYLISVQFLANDTGLNIASILAIFFTVAKIGELVLSILSGHILTKRGVKFGIVLLPAILASCFLMAFIAGFGLKYSVLLIGLIFLAKLSERVIRKAFLTPATKVIYQVTGRHQRMQIEANIDGLLNQVATVFAGLLLLGFSNVFLAKNTVPYLTAISAVCFVAGLVWLGISFNLHLSYKQKIKRYLLKLKNTKEPEPIVISRYTLSCTNIENVNTPYPLLHKKIDEAISQSGNIDSRLKHINFYNPSITLKTTEHGLKQKLITAYHINPNFFSRAAIIDHLAADDINFNLFRELWEASDFELRLRLVTLYSHRERYIEDDAYFEELCINYAHEMVWTMCVAHDTKDLDNKILQHELGLHYAKIRLLLFEMLKCIYDPASIQLIAENFSKAGQDMENQLFALELMNTMLTRRLKNILIPLLEPNDYDQKVNAIKHVVPVAKRSATVRLKEILLKDDKLINMSVVEFALVNYFELTADRKLTEELTNSPKPNIKLKAIQLLQGNKEDELVKYEVIAHLKAFYQLTNTEIAELENWGLNWYNNKQKHALGANSKLRDNPYLIDIDLGEKGGIMIDAYALALMIA